MQEDAASTASGDSKTKREEQRNMMQWLNYRADPDKNKRGHLLSEAQHALQVYAGMRPAFSAHKPW